MLKPGASVLDGLLDVKNRNPIIEVSYRMKIVKDPCCTSRGQSSEDFLYSKALQGVKEVRSLYDKD